jgi:D-alanyl-D-alanine carboxypeptidase/D-alanyl-D-alanine-endopeptidase (penicillin-binding protein 4)
VRRGGRPRRRGGRWALTVALLGAVALGAAYLLDEHPAEPSAESATRRVSTPVLSARRVPQWTTQPLATRRLGEALAPVVATAPGGTCIEVGDGTTAWFSHNAAAPLAPASNMKLLTALAAIEILGPDTTLSTSFTSDAAPSDGVLNGNLYMVGGGDPLLTTEAYQLRQRNGRLPETDLEKVADALVAAGVRQVTGSVVGDAGRYDSQTSIPTWPDRHREGGTIAPLSALLVNDAWTIDPTTGAGEGGPAADPAQHAAAVLTQLLTERGVVVAGPPVSGSAPTTATEVLSVPSLPVKDLVHEVLAFSDNTTAELLVKEIGFNRSGQGSTAAGTAAVLDWAGEAGLPVEGVVMLDGSGLSYENLVTCDLLAAVLRRSGSEGVLASGLAVPGQPGTLEDRFAQGEWPTRLRAKTGTLNNVSALSGWLLTRPGATFDFEMILNTGERRVTGDDLALQQRVLDVLVDHPVAPPLEEAGPTPAEAVR